MDCRILLSAILAAVMSTLSAQLLISSSSITEDFYKGFIRPKAAEKISLVRSCNGFSYRGHCNLDCSR